MSDLAIEVRDLSVRYPSGKHAVNGIALKVPRGGVLGLIGGNGAGKSTTLKVLAGALPASGTALISGHNMTTRSGAEAGRRLLGYCPDVGGLPLMATVRECIGLTLAATGSHDQWSAALGFTDRLGIIDKLDVSVSTLSHGEARRTSTLLAVLAARDVLLLDEPFDGMDPLGSAAVNDIVREVAANGLGVIVSTHLLSYAAEICDQVAVMSGGKIVGAAHADSIRTDKDRQRYAQLLRDSQ